MARRCSRRCVQHRSNQSLSGCTLLLRRRCKLCRLRSQRALWQSRSSNSLEQIIDTASSTPSSSLREGRSPSLTCTATIKSSSCLEGNETAKLGSIDATISTHSLGVEYNKNHNVNNGCTPASPSQINLTGVAAHIEVAKAESVSPSLKSTLMQGSLMENLSKPSGTPMSKMYAVKSRPVLKNNGAGLTIYTECRVTASSEGEADLEPRAKTDPYLAFDANTDEFAGAAQAGEDIEKLRGPLYIKSLLGKGFEKATPLELVKELQSRGLTPSEIKPMLLNGRLAELAAATKNVAKATTLTHVAKRDTQSTPNPHSSVRHCVASSLLVPKSALPPPMVASADTCKPKHAFSTVPKIAVPKLLSARVAPWATWNPSLGVDLRAHLPGRPVPYYPVQQPKSAPQPWLHMPHPWYPNQQWYSNVPRPYFNYTSPPPPCPPPICPPPNSLRTYILDGMNLLRHRNTLAVNANGWLQWEQLTAAGTYYKDRGHKVLVFLPRLPDDCNMHVEDMREKLGGIDCVVFTPSGCSDDKFMINYAQDVEESRIVTNDMFRDHSVLESWVKHRTVKFAFAGGRFIPEDIHK